MSGAARTFVRYRFSLVFVTTAVCVAITAASAALVGPDPAITAPEIVAHVRYLASQELQGRGSGSSGCQKAAEYLASNFRAAGLKPAGVVGTYFQKFEVITGVALGEPNRFQIQTPREAKTQLRVRTDYMPVAFSSSGSARGNVVFVGYGISQPDLKHDDYAGVDVKDRVVLVLRKAPAGDAGHKLEPYATLRYKATLARDKGAAGILFVSGPTEGQEEDLGRLDAEGSFSESGIPAVLVRRVVAELMLKATGKGLESRQTAMAHGTLQSEVLSGVAVQLTVSLKREKRPTANVLGLVEGSDPRLRDEVVVVGAHYDHLGLGGTHSLSESKKPEVHHGADDNASGTAGIIELAQYFAVRRDQLKRSLLFIGFSGEEMGLLGSAFFVRNPTVPLDRITAMINLDMIGRGREDSVNVIGVGTSPEWQAVLDAANSRWSLTMKPTSSGFGASDQTSFYAKGIPVLFFFTGVHPDYHRPTDTWDKINAPAEAKILGLVADTVERIAGLRDRPAFARVADPPSPGGRGFNVYIGSIPDYSDSENGVLLSGVREGSPAEKGGLKAGDRLVQFGTRKVLNVEEYTFALQEAKPNVAVDVVILREGKRLTLSIVPAPRR